MGLRWNLAYTWPTAFRSIPRRVSLIRLRHVNNSATSLINFALWFSKVATKEIQSNCWKAILSSSMSVKIFLCTQKLLWYYGLTELEKLADPQRVFQQLNVDYFLHKSVIFPYTEPANRNQRSCSLFLSLNFNIILPLTPRSPKWSQPFEFSKSDILSICLFVPCWLYALHISQSLICFYEFLTTFTCNSTNYSSRVNKF